MDYIMLYVMPFITRATNNVKTLYHKTDVALDYVSVHMCVEKPTYNLAMDNIHVPKEDLSVLAEILDLLQKTLGLVIMPLKMLNDKKFAIHVYESSSVFMSPSADKSAQDIVTVCDKMLMYIAQNRNNITEPTNKQVVKTVDLHGVNYDVPVNLWYTFEVDDDDDNKKVYFFAYVSTVQNYKSVIIAVDKNVEAEHSILPKIKQSALDRYDQTMGLDDTIQITDKQMDFL